MTFRSLRPIAALGLLAGLGACADKPSLPPCPPVYILSDAKEITKYRPGPGHDLTDVVTQAEIIAFHGECSYKERDKASDDRDKDKDKESDGGRGKKLWNVDMDLQVSVRASRGPAATSRKVDLAYFVAIPTFWPQEQGKAVFPLTISFPEGRDSVRVDDDPVRLTIPVAGKDVIDNYAIYLGFQTTPEELQHNREGK